jgi:hypothetical protein
MDYYSTCSLRSTPSQQMPMRASCSSHYYHLFPPMQESQSIQLERGLQIVDSPGIIFEDNDSIQGQKESSVLLHSVVKP